MRRTFSYFDTAVLVFPLPCSLNRMTHHHLEDRLECGVSFLCELSCAISYAAVNLQFCGVNGIT